MTEPPRPPGDGNPSDPTAPLNPYSGTDPTFGSAPPPAHGSPPPTSGAGGYGPPPSSGAGGYGPPPSSGAGGYGPPPSGPGGYGPPPGYGASGPGGYGSPAGYATNDEKTWALIAHFGGIVVGFIAPLVTLLAKGNESPTVRAHSVEALNFQITWGILTIVATILGVCTFGILFFLPMITWVVVIVFSIIAGMKANEGTLYRYPMTWRLVK
ncbi:MAG TPA: DUF4870 domain-containing protein [Actinoplanes sp.]|nr:DUF4870 domain-containing protein [Actinoplanes sp.]